MGVFNSSKSRKDSETIAELRAGIDTLNREIAHKDDIIESIKIDISERVEAYRIYIAESDAASKSCACWKYVALLTWACWGVSFLYGFYQ